jgi:hypothetical protein
MYEDIVIKVRTDMQEAKKDIKSLQREITNTPFQGWAMSVMFAGMAIQRTLSSIYKSSTKTFQEVIESVQGNVSSVTMLEGAYKYLQFAIGEALSPVVEWMIPIIDKLAEWVLENEGLTRGTFIFGMILGTLALLIGTTTLAIVNGIIPALAKLAINIGIAGGSVSTFGIALKGLSFIGIITGLIAVGLWLYKTITDMGGLLEFGKNFVRGVARLVMVLVAAIGGAWAEVWNSTKALGNFIVDVYEGTINNVIGLINKLIEGINGALGFMGVNIGLIGEVDFSGAKSEVKAFGESFSDTFSDLMTKYFELEEKLLPASTIFTPGEGLAPVSNGQAIAQPGQPGQTGMTISEVNVYTNDIQDMMKQLEFYAGKVPDRRS